jgi:hypothetical protein
MTYRNRWMAAASHFSGADSFCCDFVFLAKIQKEV